MGHKHTKTFREYLYARRSIDPVSGCWDYTGGVDLQGYARTVSRWYYVYDHYRIHWLSYIEHFGEVPEGFHPFQSCGNRRCFNPDHLTLITDEEARCYGPINYAVGSAHPQAKLTEADIPAIRAALAKREAMAKIAVRFGVSTAAIQHIRSGKAWRHVP